MPTPRVTDDDYALLRAFFAAFAQSEFGISDPLAPLRALEASAPRRAASGLRQAIEDCLALSVGLRAARLIAIDEDLAAQGLPTLSQVRWRFWRRPQAVLARGSIRTAAERAAILALADSALEAAARVQCLDLVEAFDARSRRGPLRASGAAFGR